jgi:hypothetical protein
MEIYYGVQSQAHYICDVGIGTILRFAQPDSGFKRRGRPYCGEIVGGDACRSFDGRGERYD